MNQRCNIVKAGGAPEWITMIGLSNTVSSGLCQCCLMAVLSVLFPQSHWQCSTVAKQPCVGYSWLSVQTVPVAPLWCNLGYYSLTVMVIKLHWTSAAEWWSAGGDNVKSRLPPSNAAPGSRPLQAFARECIDIWPEQSQNENSACKKLFQGCHIWLFRYLFHFEPWLSG